LLNDQSGSVLGDSTVFSWAGCHNALVPSRFFQTFSKNSDNFVETNCTSKKFFKQKLELAKGEDDGLHGMTSRCSFKAPSANASAATTQRLASTSLISGFHLTSFQELSSDHQDSSLKNIFTSKILAKLSPEPFEFPGAANRWLHLVD
jgi:hypothetical protein